MSGIRATCSSCGDVELTIDDLRLRLCIETDEGEFRFQCHSCECVTTTKISGPTFDLLMVAGAEVDEWSLPEELFETHDGPKICHDDVLEFHSAISDSDRFAEALESLLTE